MRFLGPAPSNAADLTTKAYVDGVGGGGGGESGILQPCRVVTQGSETYTIVGGTITQIAGTTINGVSMNVGDRVLVVTAPDVSGTGHPYNASWVAPNGVYVVTDNTTNITLERAADMSGSVNPAGKLVWNETGSWSGKTLWRVNNPPDSAWGMVWGTDGIQFQPILGGNGDTAIFALRTYIFDIVGDHAARIQTNPSATTDQTITLPAETTATIASTAYVDANNGGVTADVDGFYIPTGTSTAPSWGSIPDKPAWTASEPTWSSLTGKPAVVSGSVNGTPTSLTMWTGTAAQYAAISTPDANTVYIVTD